MLPLLVVVALLLRSGFLWMYVAQHPARALATIPFLFEPGNIAYSIATGNGFSSPFRVDTGPTAWMTPVYPILLAGIFRVFGTYTLQAFIAAAGFNVICSALTCVPLYWAAKRVGGVKTAVVATSLWVVFPNAVLLPYESLFDASLSALLTATILWGTMAVAESGRVRDWCLYGLLWGVGLMTNASLISLLPFLFGWAEYRAHRSSRFHLSRPVLAAGMVVLCCLPWTIRNYREFHAFVPLRSVGGLALWLGNNEQAESNSVARLHPISNQAEREKYAEMGEIAYMREKQGLAIDYMVSHPGQEARMAGERFVAIWTGGSTNPLRDFARVRSARFYYVILFNMLSAVGAISGVFILWRDRSPFAFPLTVFPVVFPLVYYLALAPPRYRHPIDPELLLLTAMAVTHLRKYKQRPLPGHPQFSS
ncbi:MAG: hypothetical protein QOJ99_1438 [Bryobacterales bacterium]|nr:hypothetical protein [Bryobacterales bacterium]